MVPVHGARSAAPANPVLRDVTERVIIASKGRFDRAKSDRERDASSRYRTRVRSRLTSSWRRRWTCGTSRRRAQDAVGHPAPFPLELPERLIGLYTFRDDLVVDPFMGSGTTMLAALCCGRRYLGYDTDAGYVAAAKRRLAEELERRAPRRPTRPEGASKAGSGNTLVQADGRVSGRCPTAPGRRRRPSRRMPSWPPVSASPAELAAPRSRSGGEFCRP